MKKNILSERPRFELHEVRSDGTEKIEICSLQEVTARLGDIQMGRQGFFRLCGLIGAATLSASCASTPVLQPTATSRPSPTKTPVPPATPTPEVIKAQISQVEVQPLCAHIPAHHGNAVVAFSPDGRLIATGGSGGQETVKIWDAASYTLRSILNLSFFGGVTAIAFSPDSRWVAAVGYDTKLDIWESESGAPLKTILLTPAFNFAVAFSPDGKILASGGQELNIQLWDPASGEPIKNLKKDNADFVRSLSFSSDGGLLACAYSFSGTIGIWDVAAGVMLRALEHKGVISISFSPRTRRLASKGEQADPTIKIWDADSGVLLKVLDAGNVAGGGALAFSPDGQLLASAHNGGNTILIWDTASGQEVRQLPNSEDPDDPVVSIAFSPDAKRLVSGGRNGTVTVWDTATFDPAQTACLFDPAAMRDDQKAVRYQSTDVLGIVRTYAMACGSALPAGAQCTCNCVSGTLDTSGAGGASCSCVPVCVCMAV